MSQLVEIILVGYGYRVLCVLLGFGFARLGYRLYVKRVLDKSEEIAGRLGKAEVILKNVAPGVVFVVAGIIIAALGVARPIVIQAAPSKIQPTPTTVPNTDESHEGITKIEAKLHQGTDLTREEQLELASWIDGQRTRQPSFLPASTPCVTDVISRIEMAYRPGESKHWWEFWKP